MKALSVKQPWANMICSGEKTVEQRTWKTDHRGDLLLVSSQKPPIAPAGQTICIVNLVDCVRFTPGHVFDAKCEYVDGSFAWVFEDIRPVKNVGISGMLGLYEVHNSVIEKIMKRPPVIYERKRERVDTCRSCGAPVWWRKMESGKWGIINAIDPHKNESHFITCPDRDKHRKRKEKAK